MNKNRSNNNDISISLRVNALREKLTYVVLPEINYFIVKDLNLTVGDCIEITNPKNEQKITTSFIDVAKIPRDIYISSLQRERLGVNLYDQVYICRLNHKYAREVTIEYFDGAKFLKKNKELGKDLENQIISKGSIIKYEKYNYKFELKVSNIIPDTDKVRIIESTKFKFEEPSLDEPILLKRLKQATAISTKVRLDTFKNFLDLDANSFIDKILEWEKEFDFKIKGDYIHFVQEDTAELIDKLKIKFEEWEETEKYPFKIKKTITPLENHSNAQKEFNSSQKHQDQLRKDELIKILANLGDGDAIVILQVGSLHTNLRKIEKINIIEKFKTNSIKDNQKVINPDLDVHIMARRLFNSLNRGKDYRTASHYIIRKIMEAGANGTKIKTEIFYKDKYKKHILRAGTLVKAHKSNSIRIQSSGVHFTGYREIKFKKKFKVWIKIDRAKKFKELQKGRFVSKDYVIEEEELVKDLIDCF